MREVNHGTVTGSLSLSKIMPLGGSNLILAKQRLLRTRKRVCESFSSRLKGRKSFALTIHLSLANPVKARPGIIVLQHRHRSETNGIAKRAVRRIKEGTSAVLLQSGLDENWWADSMECYCYLRNIQDLLADGKTPCERRFGELFKGPVIPFGALVDYHPFSTKDQSRFHQFGKKVLPGTFLGYAWVAVETRKGDILVADIEELENLDASAIHVRRIHAKEVLTSKKRVTIQESQSRMEQQHCVEEIMRSENPRQGGNNLLGVKIFGKNFKDTRRGLNRQKQKMTLVPAMTFGQWKETSSTVITSNLEFSSTCRKKKRCNSNEFALMWPELRTQIWMWCKKNVLMTIGMSTWIEICQMDRIHEVHFVERKTSKKDTSGPGGGLQRFSSDYQTWLFVAWKLVRYVNSSSEGEAGMGYWKTKGR